MVSQVARSRGWQVGEPVNLESGFDLLTIGGQRRCNDYLRSFQPDAVVFAFPCTTWSVMQQINQRTPQQKQRLEERRKEQRKMTKYVAEVAEWCRQREVKFLMESPWS